MADQNTTASVNEVECSWSDIALTLQIGGGREVKGLDFTGLKWARKVEKGKRKGPSGGRVMARTRGVGTHEASASMARSGWQLLVEALAEVAPMRGNQCLISLVPFTLVVQHTPIGSDKIYTTAVRGCLFTGDSSDMKEGADPDVIELDLDPIEVVTILPNGKEVVLV